MADNKNERIEYLDVCRLLASVLVVFVHVSAFSLSRIPTSGFSFVSSLFYDWMGLLGVPMFVMISGALLLREEYNATPTRMVKKAIHVAIIYYVWKMLYSFYMITCVPITWELVRDYVFLNITPTGHLWFLMMIAVLYLMIPVIKPAVIGNKKIAEYVIVTCAILGSIIPMLGNVDNAVINKFMEFYNVWNFQIFSSYLGYLVLGYYLSKYIVGKKAANRMLLYCLALVACILDIAVGTYASFSLGELQDFMNSPMTFTSMIAVSALFVFIGDHFTDGHFTDGHFEGDYFADGRFSGKKALRVVRKLSNYTMGVYLIHLLILLILSDRGISTLLFHPVLSVPCMVIVIYAISLVFSFVVSKIPFLNRLIKM